MVAQFFPKPVKYSTDSTRTIASEGKSTETEMSTEDTTSAQI